MFKKAFLVSLMLLTIPTFCYAQARNASVASISHARTNTSNLGVTGLDVAGNPGYIAMAGVGTSSYQTEYYLWVSDAGNLCMASWPVIQAYASFPNGSWSTNGIPCTKVGSQ